MVWPVFLGNRGHEAGKRLGFEKVKFSTTLATESYVPDVQLTTKPEIRIL